MTNITKIPLAQTVLPVGWRRDSFGARLAPSYAYHHTSGVRVHGYHGAEGLFWSWPACNISARDLRSVGIEALSEALDAARAHLARLSAKLEEV